MNLKATSWSARWGWLLFLPYFRCGVYRLPVRYSLFSFSLFLSLFANSALVYADAPILNTDNTIATAGYYQLSWSGDSESFQLQESTESDFSSYTVLYEGRDLARVISGKSNGDYYYRINTLSNSSNVVKVTVAHHSLNTAILFFLTGAVVFVSILILIIKGSKKTTV